jgi:hypothetical protein
VALVAMLMQEVLAFGRALAFATRIQMVTLAFKTLRDLSRRGAAQQDLDR